ncbi:MAG: transposase [Eubacteriales bacterium]
MNILQNIMCDHYEEMIYTLHPRSSVIENVDKMINCGDPSFGGAMYICPDCNNYKYVPFRCKSRFCPTCGNMYSIDRTTAMSFKIINVQHRHCVFTIADSLRPFFLSDRTLLNCLFTAVNSVVTRMFHKDNKSELYTPGFICVLHTFGRDLKWNPHIHCLISEGGVGKNLLWKHKKHFNYKLLRDSFQTALLNLLYAKLGDSFKKVKAAIYNKHKNGFYVYAKPNKCNPSNVIKYIGRYLGRPVIATSRIDSYDGELVTFHYNRHEDNELITETIPALDFISRLIQHIPEKHFKMIRYYGIYARHRESDKCLHRAISKEKHKFYLSFNKWRESILFTFGYDPLKCSKCGSTMLFLELYFNHKPVPLHELYERAMKKHKCRSPATA